MSSMRPCLEMFGAPKTKPADGQRASGTRTHFTGMRTMTNGVWLIAGVQAAGKSTVADLLAGRFDRGVHIRGGQFYRWAVRGSVHAGDARAAEARQLLALPYPLSAMTAHHS